MGGFTPAVRTAPTLVTGLRDVGSVPTQRVIADVRDEIIFVQPDAAPLTHLLRRFKKRTVSQYSYDWLEKDEYPRLCTVSGAQTSDDTTIELATGEGTRVPKHAVMLNRRTREKFLVTAISTDALTAVRGLGGVQEAMNDGDKVEILNTGFEDGSSRGDLKSIKEAREFNYTQIVRNAYGFTGRQLNTDMYGGRDPKTERRWQAIKHTTDIENMLLFGARHTRTGAGGKLQTFSGGVEYFVKTNVWDLNGTLPTWDQLCESAEEFMKHGRGGYQNGGRMKKWVFCSPRWRTVISKIAHDHIQYRPADKELGISITSVQFDHGVWNMVTDPLLTGAEHGGWAIGLDLNHCFYTEHQGRGTKLLDNRQANDVDGEEEEYLTDCGAEIQLEFSHWVMKGLPGF